MDYIQYTSKFSAHWNTSGWGDGGFVCIDISSCYQNLAALMLIFTFLSTLLKYMVVAALWKASPDLRPVRGSGVTRLAAPGELPFLGSLAFPLYPSARGGRRRRIVGSLLRALVGVLVEENVTECTAEYSPSQN